MNRFTNVSFDGLTTIRPPRPRIPTGIGLLACAVAALLTGCGGGVQWQWRLEPALKKAGDLRQLVLVQFRSGTDATCIDADTTLFQNTEVVKVLNEFQCVRLDYLLNKSLADRWGVNVVPTYLVLRPNGTLIDRRAGHIDPDEFRAFLKWAALNN